MYTEETFLGSKGTQGWFWIFAPIQWWWEHYVELSLHSHACLRGLRQAIMSNALLTMQSMYFYSIFWYDILCAIFNATPFSFVHLGIILILIFGFYSGLSGRVRTVYLFSLCVVSLLSSRFTASVLVWFLIFVSIWYSTFLFHWALCSFVDLHVSCGWFVSRCVQNGSESLGLKVLEDCFKMIALTVSVFITETRAQSSSDISLRLGCMLQ
jgi:hypothetical protein